jgi:hypothetical protein
MSITYREKRPYRILKQIDKSLKQYDVAHPRANIELDRRNNVSVRIRITDQYFREKVEPSVRKRFGRSSMSYPRTPWRTLLCFFY